MIYGFSEVLDRGFDNVFENVVLADASELCSNETKYAKQRPVGSEWLHCGVSVTCCVLATMRKQQLSDSSFSCLKVRGVLWFRKINATKAKSKTESRSVQMDNIQSEANQSVGNRSGSGSPSGAGCRRWRWWPPDRLDRVLVFRKQLQAKRKCNQMKED